MEKRMEKRHEGAQSVRVIQVVEVVTLTGEGTLEAPVNYHAQHWSLDGRLLADGAVIDQFSEPVCRHQSL